MLTTPGCDKKKMQSYCAEQLVRQKITSDIVFINDGRLVYTPHLQSLKIILTNILFLSHRSLTIKVLNYIFTVKYNNFTNTSVF